MFAEVLLNANSSLASVGDNHYREKSVKGETMKVPIAKIKTLTVLVSLFMLLLVAACGGNEEAAGGGDQEANGGGGGEEAAFLGDFDNFESNNDNELSQQELNQGVTDAGVFNGFDTNNNNAIDQNEFNEGASQM